MEFINKSYIIHLIGLCYRKEFVGNYRVFKNNQQGIAETYSFSIEIYADFWNFKSSFINAFPLSVGNTQNI